MINPVDQNYQIKFISKEYVTSWKYGDENNIILFKIRGFKRKLNCICIYIFVENLFHYEKDFWSGYRYISLFCPFLLVS